MRNEHGTSFALRTFAFLMSVMMTAALVPVPALAEALEESRIDEVTTVQEEVVAECDANEDASVAIVETTDEPQANQQPEVQQPVDVAQQVDDPTASMPAFEAQADVGDVRVMVRAGEGTFPDGATLSVENATADELQQAEEAVDDARDEGRNVVTSYTLDNKVLDAGGAELQPAEGHKVEVSFTLA